jgi:ATP-binding cassette subfamily B protein
VALARAFASDPKLLVLDDSTSALDSATEAEIQNALNRIQKGRTTLLITHRLSQIRAADRILVLERGRVVAFGSHRELILTSRHNRRIFGHFDHELPPLAPPPSESPAPPELS